MSWFSPRHILLYPEPVLSLPQLIPISSKRLNLINREGIKTLLLISSTSYPHLFCYFHYFFVNDKATATLHSYLCKEVAQRSVLQWSLKTICIYVDQTTATSLSFWSFLGYCQRWHCPDYHYFRLLSRPKRLKLYLVGNWLSISLL